MSASPQPRRRRWRKWFFAAAGVLLLVIVVVTLLPTFITWGLGHGIIRERMSRQVEGHVEFDRLYLSWTRGQAIRNLRVIHTDGREAADLDVDVHATLWQVITQRPGPVEVTLAGRMTGQVREDGTLSFQELLRPAPPSPRVPPSVPPRAPDPFRLPDLPPLTLNLAGVSLHLTNQRTQQTLELRDLTGAVAYVEPTQPISLHVQGTTITDGTPGSIEIRGLADQLFDPAGFLALRGASAEFDARVESMPLPLIPGLEAHAHLQSARINFASDDLAGRIVASIEARGQIEGEQPSYLLAQASIGNALTNRGEMSLRAATAHLDVQATNLPVRTEQLQGTLQQLRATVVSNDLTRTIVIAIDSNAQIEGHAPSILTSSLSVDELFRADGTVTFAIERVTGTVQGTTVPTALLEPALAATVVQPARDLGPVMDLHASFSAGEARDITLNVTAPLAQLELRGQVDTQTQTIRGSHLQLAARAHPELVRGLTNLNVDRRTDVGIRLTSFEVPPVDPQLDRRPLSQYAFTGTLAVPGPASVMLADEAPANGEPRALMVRNFNAHLASPQLAQHLDINGTAIVDDASVTINQRLSNLFDDQGALAVLQAEPVGTLEIANLRAATVMRFAPAEHADVVQQVIGPAMSATINTQRHETGLLAEVRAQAAALEVSASAIRRPDALSVIAGRTTLNLTPQLVASLQRGVENPIALNQPATLALDVQPLELPMQPGGGPFDYTLPATPMEVAVESQNLVASNLPGLAEPVGLANLIANVALTLLPEAEGGWTATTRGDVTVRRAATNQNAASVRYTIDLASRQQEMTTRALISMVDVFVPRIEQMLGQERGAISQWTGDRGTLGLRVEGAGQQYRAVIQPAMPNLEGEFTAALEQDQVSLTGRTTQFSLNRRALERRLNPAGALPDENGAAAQPTAGPAAGRTRIPEHIPLALDIRQMRLPMALVRGEGFDPRATDIDVRLSGGPAHIVSPDGLRTSLTDIDARINTRNLAEGLQFSLRSGADAALQQRGNNRQGAGGGGAGGGNNRQNANNNQPPANAPNGAAPGTLEVTGRLTNLISPESTLQMAAAQLRLNARAQNMPTAVADAAANLQGLLIAAVGPVMNANITAENFSTESGRLEARLDTTHGWLETTIIGREQSLRIQRQNPLRAQLAVSPELRERLLSRVHPVLADVRTTQQPITAHIPWTVLRLNPETGAPDLSQLDANIEITVGKVELDPGSALLGVLRFVRDPQQPAIPGEIEPITARIRNGVVTYERFVVRVDRWVMAYSGQINLADNSVNLRTELPLQALAHTFQELEPYADRIMVPLVTRGQFGDLRTLIDPDFDLGRAALEAGFRGGVQELLRGRGEGADLGPFRDALERLRPR